MDSLCGYCTVFIYHKYQPSVDLVIEAIRNELNMDIESLLLEISNEDQETSSETSSEILSDEDYENIMKTLNIMESIANNNDEDEFPTFINFTI